MADGRPSAYADLLAALLAVRPDPATARFDQELMAAEARGEIDPATARTLRWWQRESLRGLSDHLAAVLPHLLDDLAAAQSAASEAVEESAAAWSSASASTERAVNGPDPAGPPGSHLRPVEDSTGPFRPGPDLTTSSAHEPPAPPVERPAAPPRLLRPGFAPPDPDPSAQADAGPPAQVDPGAPRPRLLVSGITVRSVGPAPVVDLTDGARRPTGPVR